MIVELKEDIKELKGDVVELKDGQVFDDRTVFINGCFAVPAQ